MSNSSYLVATEADGTEPQSRTLVLGLTVAPGMIPQVAHYPNTLLRYNVSTTHGTEPNTRGHLAALVTTVQVQRHHQSHMACRVAPSHSCTPNFFSFIVAALLHSTTLIHIGHGWLDLACLYWRSSSSNHQCLSSGYMDNPTIVACANTR